MLKRFEGEEGRRLRLEAFAALKIVRGDAALSEELAERCEWLQIARGELLTEQHADTNDVFFIVSGTFEVIVNGKRVAIRGPGDHIGEMAAIQPTQKRSATVVALEEGIVGKISEPDFSDVASRNPILYKFIAQELARRLLERNRLVSVYREKIKVFIISSAESLAIARAVQNAFAHDPFIVTVWTNGVFKVANYTLEALEAAIDDSDFAIAIAHADDLTESRGKDWPAPRDNVIFELGLFMGRLGRSRAILMEPREEKLKLPSDLAGITTIPYRFDKSQDASSLLAPACNELRDHINILGPNNG
ncbi:TIR domain-containing protein [Rhizobium sp. BK377]|uniref:TIR domain-containing protein n=1 Tax=Rhizobium sp. BK377 TaxID=2587058 RepID=UPI0016090780|nr:TIR domain-containing protein [Rhizobium sp. BK377]MBB3461989.1 putative nucleotide-binding protein [Rhizobium sp. BK377]